MRIHLLIFSLTLLLISIEAKAQTIISGTVTDQETEIPLSGASVAIINSEKGTTTNEKGEFEINIAEGEKTLIITFLGYTKKEVEIKGNTNLSIRLEPSVLQLNEVVIGANKSDKKLLQSTSSVGTLTEKDFQRNNNVFLQNSLNSIAGVRMNVRSGVSQSNILIRGIGTYSRFNSRGIKAYLNGIPLSDADGTTSIDDLDNTMLGRAEVIKGPASSVYGATLGGVVLFQTLKPSYGTRSVNQDVLVGSYGLFRTNTGISLSTNKTVLLINYGHQQFDGYRKHSNSTKDYVTIAGDFHISTKQSVSILFNFSRFDDKYAGELDSANTAANPTQAYPMYLIKDVGINQLQTRFGVSHTYHFTSNFSNTTSVFTGSINYNNPIEPYYTSSNRVKYGARSVFTYTPKIGKINMRYNLGSEFIYNDNLNRRYASDFKTGAVGAVTYDTETKADQLNIFAQAEADITSKTTVTAGASYNSMFYNILDRQRSAGINYSGNLNFTPVITPRVGVVHTFNNKIAAYGNVSKGFSPPTSDQISYSTGVINKDLKPENSTSYELGARGGVIKNKINYNVSLFMMDLNNLLVPKTESGVTSYTNASKSRNKGVEVAASYFIINDTVGFVRFLRSSVAYTYNDFKYKDYTLNRVDFSGKNVVGISPNVLNVGLDLQTKYGVYANATYYYYDRMPMLNNNSIKYKTVNLFNSRIGVRGLIVKHFQYDVYAGIENIFNIHYSASLALNAAAKPPMEPTTRFFNPALPRNSYAGVSLKYLF